MHPLRGLTRGADEVKSSARQFGIPIGVADLGPYAL